VKAGYHEKVQPSMDELDYNSEGFDDGAGSEVAIGTDLLHNTSLFCTNFDQCQSNKAILSRCSMQSYC
jgi:hypothetical protein